MVSVLIYIYIFEQCNMIKILHINLLNSYINAFAFEIYSLLNKAFLYTSCFILKLINTFFNTFAIFTVTFSHVLRSQSTSL